MTRPVKPRKPTLADRVAALEAECKRLADLVAALLRPTMTIPDMGPSEWFRRKVGDVWPTAPVVVMYGVLTVGTGEYTPPDSMRWTITATNNTETGVPQ